MVAPWPWEKPDCEPGIDCSAAQPPLPWDAIAAAGITWCVVKATEAATGVDARVIQHAAGAIGAGLALDAYAFLHSDTPGIAQADNFARVVHRLPTIERWWADFEDSHRIQPYPRRALDNLLAFMARSVVNLGAHGGIYTGPGAMALLAGLPAADLAELAAWPLWVAHYRVDPANGHDYGLPAPTVPRPWTSAVAWQVCGDKGPRIPGVACDIDRNVWFGSRTQGPPQPGPTLPVSPATLLASELDDPARADTDPAPGPDPHREDT